MNKLFSIALMAVVFASCQNSDNSETTETITTDSTSLTTTVAPMPIADSSTQATIANTPANVTVAPNAPAAPTAPAASAVKTTTQSGSTAGLNPAHGAPGHRCDIAVGAPLNSPPGNTAAPAVSTAPTMSQTPPPAQPANGKARLNPAHGEPGHDCSVAVGAPLKG